MNISINWLKDYVNTTLPTEEIVDILSNVGFCAESVEKVGDDTFVDFEVTSNRGDCLGHIGLARELAAATDSKLSLPDIQLDYSDKNTEDMVSVDIEEPQLCTRYTARIIRGVKVGPSPAWLVEKLEAVGLRSVNNIVRIYRS